MKTYIIDEELLKLNRDLLSYCWHLDYCGYFDTEFCTCGLRNLKEKCNKKFKELNANKPS